MGKSQVVFVCLIVFVCGGKRITEKISKKKIQNLKVSLEENISLKIFKTQFLLFPSWLILRRGCVSERSHVTKS